MSRGISRRRFITQCGGAMGAAGLLSSQAVSQNDPFDVVIHGGLVHEGTGDAPQRVDIGIRGEAITALDAIDPAQGRATIDASGLHVAPGIVDIHSHSDDPIRKTPTAESRVHQGITTEVTGNCGSSAAPDKNGTPVARYLDELDALGVSVNQALLLGQGTLRANQIGFVDRALTAEERRALLAAVEAGMEEGAFGLSTGLEYTPGRYTPQAEIVAMARVVARYDGLYASHMRNEEARLLDAVDEALAIGREAEVRVEVSHLKAAGKPNWPKQAKAIEKIEAARAAGVDVLADAYPYTAYSTGLTIFLPNWALEDGTTALLGRLGDAEQRSRMRAEVEPRVMSDPGAYDLIVISRVTKAANRWAVGMTMESIAAKWDVDGAEAVLRLLEDDGGSVSFVGHGMSPENVAAVLAHPLVMIGSDGSSMAVPGPGAAPTQPHPRSYGTCARVLGYYVRETGTLDLPTAIRKMTSMPADQVGLRDRGRVAKGMNADLVLFDEATVAETSTFGAPHRYPVGIPHVMVNGTWVVRDGRHTGARPGRALRRA